MSDNQTADEEKTSRGIGDEFSAVSGRERVACRLWDSLQHKRAHRVRAVAHNGRVHGTMDANQVCGVGA